MVVWRFAAFVADVGLQRTVRGVFRCDETNGILYSVTALRWYVRHHCVHHRVHSCYFHANEGPLSPCTPAVIRTLKLPASRVWVESNQQTSFHNGNIQLSTQRLSENLYENRLSISERMRETMVLCRKLKRKRIICTTCILALSSTSANEALDYHLASETQR